MVTPPSPPDLGVTRAEIDGFGWNSIEVEDTPVQRARVFTAQLNLIGRLLIEIRDALTVTNGDEK